MSILASQPPALPLGPVPCVPLWPSGCGLGVWGVKRVRSTPLQLEDGLEACEQFCQLALLSCFLSTRPLGLPGSLELPSSTLSQCTGTSCLSCCAPPRLPPCWRRDLGLLLFSVSSRPPAAFLHRMPLSCPWSYPGAELLLSTLETKAELAEGRLPPLPEPGTEGVFRRCLPSFLYLCSSCAVALSVPGGSPVLLVISACLCS